MPRREELFLRDIVRMSDEIAVALHGHRRDAVAGDDLRRSAVLLKLLFISEAAARIGDEMRSRYPDVP